MEWPPISVKRSKTGGWSAMWRGSAVFGYDHPVPAIFGAWGAYRHDHPNRRVQFHILDGFRTIQVQVGSRHVLAWWQRRPRMVIMKESPWLLRAADEYRFARFTDEVAGQFNEAGDLDADRAHQRDRRWLDGIQLRTCNTPGWQTFTWDGGQVPPGPHGEQHTWTGDPPGPGDGTAG